MFWIKSRPNFVSKWFLSEATKTVYLDKSRRDETFKNQFNTSHLHIYKKKKKSTKNASNENLKRADLQAIWRTRPEEIKNSSTYL